MVDLETKKIFLDAMAMLDKLLQLTEAEKIILKDSFDKIWMEIDDLAEEYGIDLHQQEYEGMLPECLILSPKWDELLPVCKEIDHNGKDYYCYYDSDKAENIRKRFISDLNTVRKVIQNQNLLIEDQIKNILLSHERIKANNLNARHSTDFRSVHWFGTKYSFTPNQAAAVKILWENWENGTPEVGVDTLASEIDSDATRARDIFKGHPALGGMICPGQTKGTYQLIEPKK
jgi:hypothetical protein